MRAISSSSPRAGGINRSGARRLPNEFGFFFLRLEWFGGDAQVKRVLRDIDRSGQQPEEILQQISSTVYPMYKVNCLIEISK